MTDRPSDGDAFNYHVERAFLTIQIQDEYGAAREFLQAVLCAPSVWLGDRWKYFNFFRMTAEKVDFIPESRDIDALETLVENENEPMLYRASACRILIGFQISRGQFEASKELLKKATSFCNLATASERQQKINVSSNPGNDPSQRISVGTHLGILKNELRQLINLSASFDELKLQKSFAETMLCPTINSELLERVKSLPQADTHVMVEIGSNGSNHKVFAMELDKWEAEGTIKAFKLQKLVKCRRNNLDTRAKHIVGSIAMGCLYPYNNFGKQPSVPPFRPKTVFLQTKEDANDSRVRMFLSMMGCANIQVADPGAIRVLQSATRNDLWNMIQKQCKHGFTDGYYSSKGVFCGNCDKVGRDNVRSCACGAAYYCSRECQIAKWKDHKPLHQALMACKRGAAAENQGDL